MAVTADKVVVELELKDGQYLAKVRQAEAQFNRSQESMSSAAKDAERDIRNSSGAISASLVKMAASLAAAVSVSAIIKMGDAYTGLQNRLRAAGLEGEALLKAENALYEAANRNGIAVDAVAGLYQRASLAQKALGVSNRDIIDLTNGVTAALRVQGVSASQASGPLLQLGQALGAGTVRAEELNSMLEGTPLLIQAAASGSTRFAGDMNALAAAIRNGEVSSKEFFTALQVGLPAIAAQAESMPKTVAQATQILTNQLERYVGQADQSLGATEKLAAGIEALANNIDSVIPALGVIAAGMAANLIARSIASTIAVNGLSGSLVGMRTAAMAAFGGPVGIAIIGVTAAISALAFEAADAASDIRDLEAAVDSADGAIERLNPLTATGANETKGLGNEAIVAAQKVDRFAGSVGAAAQNLYELAKARQAAALAELEAERVRVSSGVASASLRTRETRRSLFRQELTGGAAATLSEQWRRGIAFFAGEVSDIWTGGGYSEKQRQAVENGTKSLNRLDGAIEQARSNLEQFASAGNGAGGGSGGGDGGSGRGGGSASERARAIRSETEELARSLASIQQSILTDAERSVKLLADQTKILARAVASGLLNENQARAIEGALASQGLRGPDVSGIDPIGEARIKNLSEYGEKRDEKAYNAQRDMFASTFSEGVRAAMNGDLKGFLTYQLENVADQAFRRLGEAIFDSVMNIPADVATAQIEGAAQGVAAGTAIGTSMVTSSVTAGTTIGGAITAAGLAVAKAIAAAVGAGQGTSTASSIFSAFGGNRAGGGPVKAGSAYTVGESGRETFVPSQNGYIIPNMQNVRANAGAPSMVKLIVDEGSMFQARVEQISGPIAVQAAVTSTSYSNTQAKTSQRRRQQSFV